MHCMHGYLSVLSVGVILKNLFIPVYYFRKNILEVIYWKFWKEYIFHNEVNLM